MTLEVSNTPSEAVDNATGGNSSTPAASPVVSPTQGTSPAPAATASDSASSDDLTDLPTEGDKVEEEASSTPDWSGLSWNGEIESLESAEWFEKNVDEQFRKVLLEGIKTKHRNLEAGFTRKTQELADKRKSFEEREAAFTDRETRLTRELDQYRRWIAAGGNATDQIMKEVEELQQKLTTVQTEREASEVALRKQLEEQFQAQLAEKLTPVEQAKLELEQQLEEQLRLAQAAEEQRNEEVRDGLIKWIEIEVPELWDDANEEALGLFTELLRTGAAQDPMTAVKMIGAVYPAFAPKAAPVPDAIDVMNSDSTVGIDTSNGSARRQSYEELKAKMMEQAQAS